MYDQAWTDRTYPSDPTDPSDQAILVTKNPFRRRPLTALPEGVVPKFSIIYSVASVHLPRKILTIRLTPHKTCRLRKDLCSSRVFTQGKL